MGIRKRAHWRKSSGQGAQAVEDAFVSARGVSRFVTSVSQTRAKVMLVAIRDDLDSFSRLVSKCTCEREESERKRERERKVSRLSGCLAC